MKTYEPVTLKKLGFGEKFLRLCLHSRRSSFRIGLIKSKIILATLALKFYVSHKRLKSKVSKR